MEKNVYPSLTSCRFEDISIIDWNLVCDINYESFNMTKDSKIMKKLISTILQADSLFVDQAFCPPNLVLKLFHLSQIVISTLVEKSDQLEETINSQQLSINELQKENEELKRMNQLSYKVPKYVFPCQYCSKMFITSQHLQKHISKRHFHEQGNNQQQNSVITVNQVSPGLFSNDHDMNLQNPDEMKEAEINALKDYYDTRIKNATINLGTQILTKFQELEAKIDTPPEKKTKLTSSKTQPHLSNKPRKSSKIQKKKKKINLSFNSESNDSFSNNSDYYYSDYSYSSYND